MEPKRLHHIYSEIRRDENIDACMGQLNIDLSELVCTIDIFLKRIGNATYYNQINGENARKKLDSTITKAYKLIAEAKTLSEEINSLNEEWKKMPLTQMNKRNAIMREISQKIDYRATIIEKARNASIACKKNMSQVVESKEVSNSNFVDKNLEVLSDTQYNKTIDELLKKYNNCIRVNKIGYVNPIKKQELSIAGLKQLRSDVCDEINNLYEYYTKHKGENLNEA